MMKSQTVMEEIKDSGKNVSLGRAVQSSMGEMQIASWRAWGMAAAAFLCFIVCLATLSFLFPQVSLWWAAIVSAGLCALAAGFVAQQNNRKQSDFSSRMSALQQQCAEAEQHVQGTQQEAASRYTGLAAASREWETTFAAQPDGIFLFDAEGHLKRANAAGTALENARAETSLADKRCCEMFWHVPGASECVVERARESGETLEVELMAGANEDQPTIMIVVPVKDSDLTGNVVVIARDVSELRRAEAEAFEHKSFMASLADLTPDEIYTLDADGRFTWMNERARTTGGLTDSALLGRHFADIVAPETREAASANLRRTQTGEDAQCEAQMIRADSTVRDVEAHMSPLWRDGNVTGALVFLRDITERKRAQDRMAQSDKLRALGELAAGVAHNLNNSLTVIQGRAQLLLMKQKNADDPASRSLEVITRAVNDSAQTLRRMLDFARRDATSTFAPIDLAELIASSVEIARPKWQNEAAARSRSINVRVENQAGVYVFGEASELREVVLNLLFNAVDAMPEGGAIEIGTRAELDGACFWVADTGSGMDEATQKRIFEPFYSTKGERGTGLGLSASHGIITRHDGQFMVASEPGEGTRIEIRLPLYEKKHTAKAQARFEMPAQARQARVLIVDDEDNVRALLCDAFAAAGHTVVEAQTGTEALARLQDQKIDLVICDLGLPEISGVQVARWVKENLPATSLILATGWAEMITPEDRAQGRIDAVITKPFAITEVLERATELLNQSAIHE
ncbi:MAG: PAS domain-containing protein [Pyrinomonadaceae bacterium]